MFLKSLISGKLGSTTCLIEKLFWKLDEILKGFTRQYKWETLTTLSLNLSNTSCCLYTTLLF